MSHTFFEVGEDVSIAEIPKIWKQDVAFLDWRIIEVLQRYCLALRKYVFASLFRKFESEPLGSERSANILFHVEGGTAEEMLAGQIVATWRNGRNQPFELI